MASVEGGGGGGGPSSFICSAPLHRSESGEAPAPKMGHSMDNLHRVGSHGTPEIPQSWLGDHRTSVGVKALEEHYEWY